MTDRAGEEDEVAELERARATIVSLERENAALCAKLGVRVEAPARAASESHRAAPRLDAVYRTAAPTANLEADLRAANARIVDLGIDNAILANRVGSRPKRPWIGSAAAVASCTLGAAVAGLATGSAAIAVIAGLGGLGGWRLIRLIDAIKPAPQPGTPTKITLPPGAG